MERPERPRSLIAKLLGLLLVSAVVASVVGTLAATGRLGGASAGSGGNSVNLLGTPHILSTLTVAQMLCPSGAAFSPDGSRLAVIGTSSACHRAYLSSTSDNAHELAIFDGHHGALLRAVQLDALVGLEPESAPAEERIRALRYAGLGWSPDGTHVAVAFTAFDSSNDLTFSHVIGSGLLLINAATGTARTILGDAGFFATSAGSYSGLPVWSVAPTPGAVTPPLSPQPGLTYMWSRDGQLKPVIALGVTALSQLPVSAGPRYPVGNPDGDSTFTLWQPGLLLGGGIANLGDGRDAFVTAFPSWSADGAFVTMLVTGIAIPAASGGSPDNTAPAGPPAYPMPALLPRGPARDAAMGAVAKQIGASGWALLAWNPSGAYLASINCLDAAGPALQVRETATGAIVGSSPVPVGGVDAGCRDFGGGEDLGDYPNPSMWMEWSPDGSHVLVTDQRSGSIILWAVQKPAPPGA